MHQLSTEWQVGWVSEVREEVEDTCRHSRERDADTCMRVLYARTGRWPTFWLQASISFCTQLMIYLFTAFLLIYRWKKPKRRRGMKEKSEKFQSVCESKTTLSHLHVSVLEPQIHACCWIMMGIRGEKTRTNDHKMTEKAVSEGQSNIWLHHACMFSLVTGNKKDVKNIYSTNTKDKTSTHT